MTSVIRSFISDTKVSRISRNSEGITFSIVISVLSGNGIPDKNSSVAREYSEPSVAKNYFHLVRFFIHRKFCNKNGFR
jgi:hypothetical protein